MTSRRVRRTPRAAPTAASRLGSSPRRSRAGALLSAAGRRSTRRPTGSCAATASTSARAASPTATRIPGPGIRYLLFGSITIDSEGAQHTYGPGEPWFERGPDPVLATTAADEPSAFVRVMLLPVEWAGQRTIRYVDPADAEKPKTQRATDLPGAAGRAVSAAAGQVLVDQLVLHGADLAFGVPGESYLAVLDALHDAPHAADRHAATRAARRTWPRPTGSSPAARASASSRAARARRTRPTACTPRSRTRRRCCC